MSKELTEKVEVFYMTYDYNDDPLKFAADFAQQITEEKNKEIERLKEILNEDQYFRKSERLKIESLVLIEQLQQAQKENTRLAEELGGVKMKLQIYNNMIDSA